MSASSKKKARSEANSAKLTEKQLAEKKEAAKNKAYTVTFAVVLAVLVVIAVCVGTTRIIANSGIRENRTIAVTIGNHEVSNAELNYYYMDAINNFNSNYGSYAVLYGLDVTKPLNEQVTNEETGATWADDFIDSAISSAKTTYALVDAAKAEGFTLPEDQQNQIETLKDTLGLYATMGGYENADAYVRAMYGNGSNLGTYLEYYSRNALANAYYNAHHDSLTYDAAAIKAADDANPAAYSSYAYSQYYLPVSKFLENASEATDEQKAEAAKAAEEAAKTITADSVASVDDFNAAIAGLAVNADTSASSSSFTNQAYNSINSNLVDWLTDTSRKEGDKTVVASVATDGTVNGYYAAYFTSVSDNKVPMVNVRHVLISFQGGTTENGVTTYSDEEKAAAKTSAETLLNQWKAGDATEESFAALAAANSTDTGSASNGGLYENVYPGQMVTNFNNWCFDSSRKPGDTGIVETEYGYHIIYFVSADNQTYRDYLISEELRDADMDAWFTGLQDAKTVTNGDIKYLRKDLVINSNAK